VHKFNVENPKDFPIWKIEISYLLYKLILVCNRLCKMHTLLFHKKIRVKIFLITISYCQAHGGGGGGGGGVYTKGNSNRVQ
jgi:hypothetical protein